ncbi:tRNA-intron endonuclease [Verruconis gallopava]|uniref:tRNA-splicing endonuclease subunit Sen2 n=1 Tax=Verruconis gallopava TaxID=253628 RepID=A0A0D1XXA4_9PEZI|nr:tRNA-intron endonuclease [Verruconis gallopava]KIW07406.1 tRNA-intron endonuclease [Verruconis gallopava]
MAHASPNGSQESTVVRSVNEVNQASATTPKQSGETPHDNATSAPSGVKSSATGAPKTPGPRRPNYAKIHARKLPLDVYPLPTFQPHNPLSLVPILYILIRDFILPRSSHSRCPFHASFSSSTQSVHVTDEATVRALWEDGFFGKGTLSRSEPNWLASERRRLGLVAFETAEEFSARRRKEREEFKKQRAKIEKELVEQVRQREAQGLSGLPGGEAPDQIPVIAGTRARELMELRSNRAKEASKAHADVESSTAEQATQIEIINQEHLQLSLVEAFFLTYALGVLQMDLPPGIKDNWDILELFRQHSYFPPAASSALQPDDPFLLHYVVYHHFRSLGWVVREGIKFAVDFLLYERGVVFSHAAFAVLILPSYSDPDWFSDPERRKKVERQRRKKTWHWFHCANRVQNQVLKTLVLVYVNVPSIERMKKPMEERDVGGLLELYRVREFSTKRWSANRNRE